MHDLATPHAAAATQKVLKKEEAKVLPWFPKGADVNPMDLFARNSINEELGKTPMKSRNAVGKLQASLTRAIAKMSAEAAWVGKVTRACKSAAKRLRWIQYIGGKKIIGKPWRRQDA